MGLAGSVDNQGQKGIGGIRGHLWLLGGVGRPLGGIRGVRGVLGDWLGG